MIMDFLQLSVRENPSEYKDFPKSREKTVQQGNHSCKICLPYEIPILTKGNEPNHLVAMFFNQLEQHW